MKVEPGKAVLSANDEQALKNRARLDELALAAVNVMASPGAGKTSVIVQLLHALKGGLSLGVIEGDVASSIDTDRIISLGYKATQINTNGGCHLTAAMIDRAIDALGVRGPGLLFIENIGNLICPATYKLGEQLRLVIASVAEGDDKPVKYPGMFTKADAVVLNKIDLLPHIDFRMDFFTDGIRAANANAPIFLTNGKTGEGIPAVRDWLMGQIQRG